MAELGDRIMEVRYEDLLEHPYRELSALAAFCSLPASSGVVGQAAGRIRPARALAYQHDPMLRELAERWREQLQPFGYRLAIETRSCMKDYSHTGIPRSWRRQPQTRKRSVGEHLAPDSGGDAMRVAPEGGIPWH